MATKPYVTCPECDSSDLRSRPFLNADHRITHLCNRCDHFFNANDQTEDIQVVEEAPQALAHCPHCNKNVVTTALVCSGCDKDVTEPPQVDTSPSRPKIDRRRFEITPECPECHSKNTQVIYLGDGASECLDCHARIPKETSHHCDDIDLKLGNMLSVEYVEDVRPVTVRHTSSHGKVMAAMLTKLQVESLYGFLGQVLGK